MLPIGIHCGQQTAEEWGMQNGNEPSAKRKEPDYYDEQAIEFIRHAMRVAGVKPVVLAARLHKLGYEKTDHKNLLQRIQRGSFSAGFFLRCLKVLEVETVDMAAFKSVTREQDRVRLEEQARALAKLKRALK